MTRSQRAWNDAFMRMWPWIYYIKDYLDFPTIPTIKQADDHVLRRQIDSELQVNGVGSI